MTALVIRGPFGRNGIPFRPSRSNVNVTSLGAIDNPIPNWLLNLFWKLQDVVDEHAVEGWDGYDALPIYPASARNAHRFLLSMPRHLASPEIVPEPDGEISLEWGNVKIAYASLSFNPDGRCTFASVLTNGDRLSGCFSFKDDIIPDHISRLVQQVSEQTAFPASAGPVSAAS